MDNSELYEIQYIFGSQILDNKMQYCVKWKNYPKSQRTWEPIENLGVHNISSVRRFQRHADYFLFYQFIYEDQVEGYRVHQKQNTLEKIKVIPDPQEEEEQIEQANTDKLNTTLKETVNKPIITPKETTKRTNRSSRKQTYQKEEYESHSDSKDSDFGRRGKKSRSKAKSSQSRRKSPTSAGDKSNQTQPKKSQFVKQEQVETDEINPVQQKSQERQPLPDQDKQNEDNLSEKSKSPKGQQKVQTRLRNLRNQKSVEQIKSPAYFNSVRKLIQSLNEDERSLVASYINDKMKDNIFENLGALCILDYMQRKDEVLQEIKQQEYVYPQKGDPDAQQNKQKKRIKKLEKSSIKMESQRSTDIACPPISKRLFRLSAFEQKRKLIKKKEDPCNMADFLASINQFPQFGVVLTEVDTKEQYGQIGFQMGEEITGHYYGINANEVGKANIQLYFIMKFRREGDKTFLYNHVTKAECQLYEKDLLYDYVYKNQDLLPEMYNELIVRSVYNQQ
ncbi:unnamed protein product (macronuclear) [Paramecium tetraurelia]|uniref:Chromo domain-containing protein n=1 Tax=Paramecium tetraurelia TaxID=5888 RepID=A0CNA4_PARTE|nr:uncharacterized protein GSPATT00008712001 [Paramecium tetraurelia]CAK72271.1 unnamed protein product [Paramecium tetraurelia]|eukprot:XP_001439668.1 hypothetical protein (macronuclear) [Paramecium tetraurelia strain d4-2]